ncbi:MAG: hypothetical protein ACE5OY_08095 [Candidatus Bathyarchaeia archaeon]
MDAKNATVLGLKVAILTLLLSALFSINFLGLSLVDYAQTAPAALLMWAFLDTVVLSYPIIRSRWTGWCLVLAIFFLFYGVMTFLSQIETVVFLQYLVEIVPAEMIPALFLNGAITAALFSPLAVLVLGRMRGSEEEREPNRRLIMPWKEWVWKLALIAVVYVVVYISFGALVFIPIAGKAAQEYYAGLELPGWILPFQAVRAMIWTALALPVIRMMKGRWWETGLAVALLFSVLMSTLLLVPSELMPETVRLAHFVEVFSSNFLFGWIVVWLLHLRQRVPT